MSFTAAACGIPLIVTFLTVIPATVIVSHPDALDAYAVLGAMMATALALIESRMKDRSLSHTISVFITCSFIGSVAPGLAVSLLLWKGYLAEDVHNVITWHVWAIAGFIFGMNAWGMMELVKRISAKWLGIVGDRFGRRDSRTQPEMKWSRSKPDQPNQPEQSDKPDE